MLVTREPGGSAGAEAIRDLLLERRRRPLGPEAEALLFAAARADHVERRSARRWRQGRWVLCDRFVDSSLAYQGGAGGLGIEAVRAINAFGIGECFPDRTLVLLLDDGAGARAQRATATERPDRRALDAIITTRSRLRSA